MNDFDIFFSKNTSYFGKAPSDGLVEAIKKYQIPKGKALDIGAGEGRNSLYLTHLGFDVDALEPTRDGAQKIKNGAKKNSLRVNVINTDYLSHQSEDSQYDFILAATSLDHMNKEYINEAIKNLKRSLKIGGFIYIVVFTEDDPGYLKNSVQASECSPFIQHYFKKEELREYFSDFNILFYDEYEKEDRSHGKPHYHAKAKIIAQKI